MTAIKERPILFSTPMVRAILEGRKTMTRRCVTNLSELEEVLDIGGYYFTYRDNTKGFQRIAHETVLSKCPQGKVGDRLWVKETWQHSNSPNDPLNENCAIFYRADYWDDPHGMDGEKSKQGRYRKWKSSLFMPRSASRILLEITNVKIEQLQSIIPEECLKEGVEYERHYEGLGNPCDEVRMIHAFIELWDSISGKDKTKCWDANPWVWVIEFRRSK